MTITATTIPDVYAQHGLPLVDALPLDGLADDPAGGWRCLAVRFGWSDVVAAVDDATHAGNVLDAVHDQASEAQERIEQARLTYQEEQVRRAAQGEPPAVAHTTLLTRIARDLALVALTTPWIVDAPPADPVDAAEAAIMSDPRRCTIAALWASSAVLADADPSTTACARRMLLSLCTVQTSRALVTALAAWRTTPHAWSAKP
jgi:hypothetical protein